MPHGRTLRSLTRVSLFVFGTLATATACSEIVTQVGEADIVSLRVSPDSARVRIARTLQLRALPLDATGALIAGQAVTWSSMNGAVATVDDTGLVTGVSTGTAEIVASAAGFEASATITVTPPTSIALSADSIGFATTAGGADPAPDTVQIMNGGASTLTGLAIDSIVYSAGATGWLTALLSASTAPTSLVLTPDATGVTTAGVYVAIVWVSGFDADNSPSPVTVTLEITSGAVASVAAIAIQSGDSLTAITGNNVSNPPTVLVTDQFGNGVPGVTVDFSPLGGGSVGTPSATTNASGVAMSTWTVSVTGSSMGTDGTYANSLDATVQGTAFTTQFSGFAVYSYQTHVDPIWVAEGCTGCHDTATTTGLILDRTSAQNYSELVNVIPVCDAFASGARIVSNAGGVAAADQQSVLMFFVDGDLAALPAGDSGLCDGSFMNIASATQREMIRAWIRNGAPNN